MTGGHHVLCPPGKVPLGGGAGVSEVGDDEMNFFDAGTVEMDFPLTEASFGEDEGWQASFRRNSSVLSSPPFVTTVYAICAFVEG